MKLHTPRLAFMESSRRPYQIVGGSPRSSHGTWEKIPVWAHTYFGNESKGIRTCHRRAPLSHSVDRLVLASVQNSRELRITFTKVPLVVVWPIKVQVLT